MKKIFILFAFLTTTLGINAQKFALVDMEYILKNIPAYERANEQLAQVSKKWHSLAYLLTGKTGERDFILRLCQICLLTVKIKDNIIGGQH